MGIINKVTRNIAGLNKKGDFPVYYLYTTGAAGRIFFGNLKEKGEFTGGKCPACSRVYFPLRIYCEECFEEIKEFVKLPLKGRVVTFTVVARDIDGRGFDAPRTAAFVNIEGSCGGIFGFVKDGGVEIGDQVEAVLKSKKERNGTMDDILHFRKL
ncbi:MAG: Zn-ribbon domain-containing OB-fold protein [Deltaproteobacteria bacterium]|nr:Zn-ribbon domain-containing OB-fold protein [Deltaproteobacteria bacterium]